METATRNGKTHGTGYVDQLVEAARDLHERGYVPLPLRDGKNPGFKEWPTYEFDEQSFRRKLYKAASIGVGLLMGPRGRIVDFEYDAPAQLAKLLSLFPDRVPPIGPQFESTHGGHFLFAWDDRLAAIGKAVLGIRCDDGSELKLRIGAGPNPGAQSAVPPSPGKVWKPTLSLIDCTPPALPQFTVDAMLRHARTNRAPTAPTIDDDAPPRPSFVGSERSNRCLGAMLRVDVPGDEHDGSKRLVLVCRQAKRYGFVGADAVALVRLYAVQQPFPREWRDEEIIRRVDDANVRIGEALDEPAATSAPDGWRLEILESKPRVLRLYSPDWPGAVELTTAQYRNWSSIATQVLEQCDTYLTNARRGEWQGNSDQKSLAGKLVERATHLAAPVDASRDCVIAELLWDALRGVKPLGDGYRVDPAAFPVAAGDGSIEFKFGTMFERLTRLADKVTRRELSDVLAAVGAVDKQRGDSGSRFRVKRLGLEQLAKLKALAGVDDGV